MGRAPRQEAKAKGLRSIGSRGKWLGLVLLLGLAVGCSLPNQGLNQDFVQGLRPAPGDMDRLLHNAHYLKLMGRPQLALKELEEAYQADPGNSKIANLLAGYYDDLGMGERAQQIYLAALARAGDDQTLSNNLCFSYYLAGKFDQAETCFRQTLARQPDNAAARNNLGLLLCRLGREQEARSLWEAAAGKAAAAEKLQQALAALGRSTSGAGSEQAARPRPPAPQPLAQAGSEPGPARPAAVVAAGKSPAGGQGASPPPPVSKLTAAPAAAAPGGAVAAKAAVAAGQGQAPGGPPEAAGGKTAAAPAPPRPPILAKVQAASPPAPLPAAPAGLPAQARAKDPAGEVRLSGPRPAPITHQELLGTQVEVANGNGIPDLAHEARHLLNLEGFDTVTIANHIDFGMEQTVIRYRSEAQKVARFLHDKFFTNAALQSVAELKDDLDIQVIMGHDLSSLPQTVAKTAPAAPGGQEAQGLTHRDARKTKPDSRAGEG